MRLKEKRYLSQAIVFTLLLGVSNQVGAYSSQNPITSHTELPKLVESANSIRSNAVYGVNNGASLIITGDSSTDIIASSGESVGIDVNNGHLEAKGLLSINMAPAVGTTGSIPKPVIIRNNASADIDHLQIKGVLSSENTTTQMSPDSNATYGLTVGYAFEGGNGNHKAEANIRQLDVEVTNTADSVIGNYQVTRGFASANIKIGHQLSAVRVYHPSSSDIPSLTVEGPATITAYDSSTAKAGDYLVGLYIDGNQAKATFKGDTKINVEANGINSAGIKIGKVFDGSLADGASVEVTDTGKLTVDTTKTANSAAIRLFGSKSQLYVKGTDQSEIKAGDAALVFDTQDYKTSGTASVIVPLFNGSPSRNEDNIDNKVELNNTKLTTTSTTAPLIKARTESVNDVLVEGAGVVGVNMTGKFNNGDFNTQNAQLTLSGDKSLGIVGDSADQTAGATQWLVDVEGIQGTVKPSDLSITLKDKAQGTGLINKNYNSKLHLIVDGGIWNLRDTTASHENTVVDNTSTANAITLFNDGFLNAVYSHPNGGANHTIVLTDDAGTTNTGTFTNGGIISLDNRNAVTKGTVAYDDVLNIEGAYVGNNGLLEMNTKWDSPGDDNGANSQSDLLHIKGTSVGITTVVAMAANGARATIDGTIASIDEDLRKNSVKVVEVDSDDGGGTFIGTAKTLGAGELQLTSKVADDGHRIYYWTVTGKNKGTPNQPQTPIFDPAVPSYVQMGQVGNDMMGTTLQTYHERHGETAVTNLSPAYMDKTDDQAWARLIGRKVERDGTRLGYDLTMKGIQIGHDYDSYFKEGEGYKSHSVYFSYLTGSSKFRDHLRAENGVISSDSYTGKVDSKMYSLGWTRTKYQLDGRYLDIVGQVSYMTNDYTSRQGVKGDNHGFGFAGSAEIGRPKKVRIKEYSNWLLEPQAQLIYRHLSLSDFTADGKSISQDRNNSLVGRIGGRISYNRIDKAHPDRIRTYYGVANIWHSFTGQTGAHIGQDVLSESYPKTTAEIGLGLNLPIKDSTYIYGDLRYEWNLGGSGDYKAYRANLGLKYRW